MKIEQMEGNEKGRFYLFFDLAGKFWPEDYEKGNHTAEDRVIARLMQKGCREVAAGLAYDTPKGRVYFDSESGAFECHAPRREPVEFVLSVINGMLDERQKAREVLS